MNTSTVRSRSARVSSSLTAAIMASKAVPACTPFTVRKVASTNSRAPMAASVRTQRGGSAQPRCAAA